MDKEDKKFAEQNCHKRLKITGQLRNWLKKQNKIVLLFSITQTIGNSILQIGQWMLGNQITRTKKFNYSIKKFQGNTTEFNLTGRISFHAIEQNGNGVLAVNFTPLSAQPQKKGDNTIESIGKDTVEVLCMLQVVKKEMNQTRKLLYYYAVNANNSEIQIKKQIKNAKKFVDCKDIRFIMCEQQQQQQQKKKKQSQQQQQQQKDSQQQQHLSQQQKKKKKISLFKKKTTDFPYKFDQLFQKSKENQDNDRDLSDLLLSSFMNKLSYKESSKENENPKSPQKKKEVDMKRIVENKFREIQKELTSCLRELFQNIPKIVDQILQIKKKEKNLFQNLLEEIKTMKENMLVTNEMTIKKKPNDSDLAGKNFVLQVIEIRNKYEVANKIKDINSLKQFCTKIFEQLMMLNYIAQEDDITLLNVYAWNLLEQNQIVHQLTGFPPLHSSVTTALNVNIFSKLKVAQAIVKTPIKFNKDCAYYDLFLQIIKGSEGSVIDAEPLKKDTLQKEIAHYRKYLPVYKQLAMMNSTSHKFTPQQIGKVISQILTEYFSSSSQKEKQTVYDFKFLHQLFDSVGKKLRQFGFPELALQVYQKLKFVNKIDQCVKEAVYKYKANLKNCKVQANEKNGISKINNKNNKNSKTKQNQKPNIQLKSEVDLYSDISKYYEQIGLPDKAYEYAQLAYQHVNSLEKIEEVFKKMVGSKKNKIANIINQKESECIEKSEKQNYNSYMNFQFTQNFKDNVRNASQLLSCSELNTNIQIKKQEITQLFN